MLAAQSAAYAASPYVWKNVKVGGGGFIPGIVFNTTQPGLAYCRSDIGSSYKWDNQAKKWIPLTDWCGVANLHGSESTATDPIDPQRVYIAAGMGQGRPAAILRSMDQGKTFQVIDVPFTMGGNSNGRGVGERLAIDPNDNDILYFGSRRFQASAVAGPVASPARVGSSTRLALTMALARESQNGAVRLAPVASADVFRNFRRGNGVFIGADLRDFYFSLSATATACW
jgi:hypothetical protein